MLTLLRWPLRLAAVAALLLVAAWFSLGPLAKAMVEHYGPRVTGGFVSVRAIRLSPFAGEATLEGIDLGNPPGFSSAPALHLDRATVRFDPAALLRDPIVIREVAIEGAGVFAEVEATGLNLDAMRRNAEAVVAALAGERAAAPPAGRRYVIDRFLFSGGRVSGTLAGIARTEAAIPPIALADIGKKSGGEKALELSAQLFAEVIRGAAQAAGRFALGRDKVNDLLRNRVKNLFKK